MHDLFIHVIFKCSIPASTSRSTSLTSTYLRLATKLGIAWELISIESDHNANTSQQNCTVYQLFFFQILK